MRSWLCRRAHRRKIFRTQWRAISLRRASSWDVTIDPHANPNKDPFRDKSELGETSLEVDVSTNSALPARCVRGRCNTPNASYRFLRKDKPLVLEAVTQVPKLAAPRNVTIRSHDRAPIGKPREDPSRVFRRRDSQRECDVPVVRFELSRTAAI